MYKHRPCFTDAVIPTRHSVFTGLDNKSHKNIKPFKTAFIQYLRITRFGSHWVASFDIDAWVIITLLNCVSLQFKVMHVWLLHEMCSQMCTPADVQLFHNFKWMCAELCIQTQIGPSNLRWIYNFAGVSFKTHRRRISDCWSSPAIDVWNRERDLLTQYSPPPPRHPVAEAET